MAIVVVVVMEDCDWVMVVVGDDDLGFLRFCFVKNAFVGQKSKNFVDDDDDV